MVAANPDITLKRLAELASVSRTTVHRFFHDQLDKTIFVSGWLTWEEGGMPSPLIRIKASEHDASVPRPLPQNDQQRSSRYNTRTRIAKNGVSKAILQKDPILKALLGLTNG